MRNRSQIAHPRSARTFEKAEIDRLAELANVGAGHAAGAFAQLVDRPIWVEAPVVVEGDESGRRPAHGSHWCTGVFFEFAGCLDALVGILFPRPASEAMVRRIVGVEPGALTPERIESSLMEVGNILASHVASAIADTLQARLLPSTPSLAMQDAEHAFSAWIEARLGEHTLQIESALHDRRFELEGRLVLVPTHAEGKL